MSSSSSQSLSEIQSERLTGRVKWFNSKAGYGFITVCGEGDQAGNDIFVHFSSIRVDNSQYKYLVQGEYVEFSLVKSENESHAFHAVDISGIKGGLLMCQTQKSVPIRIVAKRNTRVYDSSERYDTGSEPSKPSRRQPVRNENGVIDENGFTKVSRGKKRVSAHA